MAKGMGFNAASRSVQRREGVSASSARAIIAAGARNASRKAVRANPRLKRVSGVRKSKRGGAGR